MRSEILDIEGMTCSACVSKVERALTPMQGMYAARANAIANNLHVRYDEGVLTMNDIVAAVQKAGYKATPRTTPTSETGQNPALNHPKKHGSSKHTAELIALKNRWQWSLAFLVPLMYVSMGHMVHLPLPAIVLGKENQVYMGLLQLLLTTPVYFFNRSMIWRGFTHLWRRSPNMDSLIALGTSAAMLYSVYVVGSLVVGKFLYSPSIVFHHNAELYFESGATILALVTLGKFLEARSKGKTTEAVTQLMQLSPVTAWVKRDGAELEIAVDQVVVGDTVIVKPGTKVPVDGLILFGNGTLDESMLTGESIAVYKKPGEKVMAGTINQLGYFTFKAESVGENTTIAQIIRLVEEASTSKAPIAKMADAICAVFVPIVLVISLLVVVVWLLAGYSIAFALSAAIAVLVISCPCALGLATPVAVMVGTGRAATEGILVKSAESFEIASAIDTVVLDKTGTLTEGKPAVKKIVTNRFMTHDQLMVLAASLEMYSEHPLARAIVEEARFRELTLLEVHDFETAPGMGITGTIQNKKYFAGNATYLQQHNLISHPFQSTVEAFATEGITPLYVANAHQVMGVIGVADVLKSDSKAVVDTLKNMRLTTVMLSGDVLSTAMSVGQTLGIDKVFAGLLPVEKVNVIEQLQATGAKLAMVGDGVNDAPALVKAQLGIAIGTGTDIAIESADVVLLGRQLSAIPRFFQLSRKVMLTIRQNLFWSFFYNVIGIPLAAGVFYPWFGWTLSPMFAAAAMSISSVTVVLNALRLRKKKS